MSLLRPTLQGRAGFDPKRFGPGVNAPFGRSSDYPGYHNGQDYFWLGAASARRLNISTAASLNVYPVKSGKLYRIDSSSLGLGLWQQLDSRTRIYYWHLRSRVSTGTYSTARAIGVMGHTGSAAGNDNHLHLEVRVSPYGSRNRVNPEPFFKSLSTAQRARYKKIAAFLNPHAVNVKLPKTTTAYDGIPGPNYWELVQAVSRAWRFYSGAVDGKPGNLTYAAEAKLWADYVNKPKPASPPEPAPEPEPIVIVIDPPAEPVPEPTPDEPEPTPAPEPETPTLPPSPKPAPVEPGQPDPPPQHAKPQNASGLVAIIVGVIVTAVTAILAIFGQGPTG